MQVPTLLPVIHHQKLLKFNIRNGRNILDAVIMARTQVNGKLNHKKMKYRSLLIKNKKKDPGMELQSQNIISINVYTDSAISRFAL